MKPNHRQAVHPPELVVYDGLHPCPYLPDRRARLPMRLPSRPLAPEELDGRLAEGDRRHGHFLYRPSCPACRACEAIRIDVKRFSMSASRRRVLRRGRAELEMQIGEPKADLERLALYEKHKQGRQLGQDGHEPLDLRGYRSFLVDRSVPSLEITFWHEERLVAVSIADVGATALSAVYCLWDPELASLGLGTYAILEQIELCRRRGLEHIYLGLFVEGNPHMRYKASFRPHERLVEGRWTRFE